MTQLAWVQVEDGAKLGLVSQKANVPSESRVKATKATGAFDLYQAVIRYW